MLTFYFSIDPCENACQNGGGCTVGPTWEEFACFCPPGYSGTTCEITPCTNVNCENGSTCKIDGSTFECENCPAGFTGNLCDVSPCDLVPPICQNGAACSPDSSAIANDYVECTCLPGYTGPQCEISPCAGNTCSNHGTCKVVNVANVFTGVCECEALDFTFETLDLQY